MQSRLCILAVMPFLNNTDFILTRYLSLQVALLLGTIPTFL